MKDIYDNLYGVFAQIDVNFFGQDISLPRAPSLFEFSALLFFFVNCFPSNSSSLIVNCWFQKKYVEVYIFYQSNSVSFYLHCNLWR